MAAAPSLADVMSGGPSTMMAPSGAPEAEEGEIPSEDSEVEQEKQDYAWEFRNAQTPGDAATALEAFVRLIK
jgi:hypothetical protein